MLRSAQCMRVIARHFADEKQPVLRVHDAVRKRLDEVLGETKEKKPIPSSPNAALDISELSGVPEVHKDERIARIYRPARETTQAGWNNTKSWKIELDNRPKWENHLMGWASTGDPLSNVSMNMDFASKEDAVAFCEKNSWQFEVDQKHDRQIKSKTYGSNFAWNKRTRVGTK